MSFAQNPPVSINKPNKPFWKHWWVWIIALALISTTAAALYITVAKPDAPQARSDQFESEIDKLHAYEVAQCKAFQQLDPQRLAIKVKESTETPPESFGKTKLFISDRLQASDSIKEVLEFDSTGMCSGWLWDWEKMQPGYKSGYENFTYDRAVEAGVHK